MLEIIAHLLQDPAVALYSMQACTYGVAAALSRHLGHSPLAICYAASAIIHGLLGACHFLHLG